MSARWRRYGARAISGLTFTAKFGAWTWLIFEFVGGPVQSTGWSMYPTMPPQSTFYIEDRLTLRLHGSARLYRGDIVTALKPTERGAWIAKRVIGLPGDVICVDPLRPERGHVLVPKGHVWLAGDNLSNSTDSRTYGPVPIALLKGHLRMQLTNGFKRFKNPMKSVSEIDERGRLR